VPDGDSDDEPAFTVIASSALQGIRNLRPELGETVVVTGLGLIGLIAAMLLKANGCRVVGIEFDKAKNAIAEKNGILTVNPAEGADPVRFVEELTGGVGADGVLITASSKSDDIIHQACQMCRKRGRLVLVGVVGMNMRRDDFYKKELSFTVSCSYGAGRYDEEYENKGHDYPVAYARWTEKRNFEAVLQTLEAGSLDVRQLITEEVDLQDYARIYGDMRKQGSIASIIRFPEDAPESRTVELAAGTAAAPGGKFGIIGAGNYTSSMVVPCLRKAGAPIRGIASAGGLNAKILARKAGAELATSDYRELLSDPQVGTVIITTRHNLHAPMVREALESGKNVFVEKPLCLNEEQLEGILEAAGKAPEGTTLTVGFNRRFSPFAVKMKSILGDAPMNIVATMNAGFIPPEVWVHDLETGGGRIIGEACHFIDLCSFLAGSPVAAVCMNALGENPEDNTDNASILLRFENGSNAVINYFANGSKSYPKEKVEVFCQGKVLSLDNWRKLSAFGVRGFRTVRGRMDKGQARQFALLTERLRKGGEPLIPLGSIVNTTRASFAALRSLKEKRWIEL
ncbi:MAG: bi-domain-containing oxidoreductase, partial [Bacteroidales bacterium]|nr:bi-domain-containing oxidoreductase [Bacteroidales bacterium]